MKKLLLFLPFLFKLSFASEKSIICGGKSIEHCTKCSSGKNSNTCEICEDKYFPIFNGLSCVACNDSTYGQIACEGKCDGSNYAQTKFAFCEKEGCKEGYYNLNGICIKCSEGTPHCSKCNYEMNEDKTIGKFICLECESGGYSLTPIGTCQLCSMEHCKSCHFNNNSNPECDDCYTYYYKSSDGNCKHCYNVDIIGGRCQICSDNDTDYESGSCLCDQGYTKVGLSHCERCPDNCIQCTTSVSAVITPAWCLRNGKNNREGTP